jgi:saccharopine dehydrogenase-like NADP-dependent oxidoreductase
MVMKRVLMLGAGKVGSLIACLLSETGDYRICVGDTDENALRRMEELARPNLTVHSVNAMDRAALKLFLESHDADAVISCLPYYCNFAVAEAALKSGLHYFDLTEDVEVARYIAKISPGAQTALVPQCGLAPGFISIIAQELMTHFEALDTVKLRVGALPINPSNALKYSLTWSTDGLINEYGNLCHGVEDGQAAVLLPLEGYETIEVDGLLYEGFNTSGGIGTLAETYHGKVRTMNYKTLRYPGHCEKVHFLMQDLKLNEDRATLKRILENAVPKTVQDVVLIYASVTGKKGGELFEENYVKKIYPKQIAGRLWASIQVTTAGALCAVVDLILHAPSPPTGFVTQESIRYTDFLENRFGQCYR